MQKVIRHFDLGSIATIVITLGLFIVALFTKGFSHDLLLEAGVFLVSVKLILMSFKQSVAVERLEQKLDDVLETLQKPRP